MIDHKTKECLEPAARCFFQLIVSFFCLQLFCLSLFSKISSEAIIFIERLGTKQQTDLATNQMTILVVKQLLEISVLSCKMLYYTYCVAPIFPIIITSVDLLHDTMVAGLR